MSGVLVDEPTIVVDSPVSPPKKQADHDQVINKSYKFEIDNSLELPGFSNRLLVAGSTILGILGIMHRLENPQDLFNFRQKMIDQIACFRQKAVQMDYHPSVIEKSCFVLAAALDEAVLNSGWQSVEHWENNTILSQLFNQRNGGEVFFDLLEQAKKMSHKLIDFIELQYYLMALGFKGKYRNYNQGQLTGLVSEVSNILKKNRKDGLLPVPKTFRLGIYQKPSRLIKKTTLLTLVAGTIFAMGFLSEGWYQKRQEGIVLAISNLQQYIFNEEPQLKKLVNYQGDTGTEDYEIVLITLTKQESMSQLIQIVKSNGYENARLVYTGVDIELLISGIKTMTEAKKIKSELLKKFNLEGYIRKKKSNMALKDNMLS